MPVRQEHFRLPERRDEGNGHGSENGEAWEDQPIYYHAPKRLSGAR